MATSFKKRFKRALASFLREELLEYIGYNHKISFMSLKDRFEVDNQSFETVIMEDLIEFQNSLRSDDIDRFALEQDILQAKQDFANRVMEHIHVDAQNLVSDRHFHQRSVRLILRVQTKK